MSLLNKSLSGVSVALILFLTSCGPIQATHIESMGTAERQKMLESRSDQELCNAFTHPSTGLETKDQLKTILKKRHVLECHGKFGAFAYVEPPKVSPPVKLKSRELTAAEKSMIATAVKNNLKDPESAKFKWNKLLYSGKADVESYCGYVNARNSYGGYTGFDIFNVILVRENGKFLPPLIVTLSGAWSLCEEYR